MVPSFLLLAHLEEAILVWHLSIGKTKITENIIKTVAIHDMIDSKWITFIHRWCRCGPPVLTTFNSNPACHVYPTTNPLYILLKIHWHTQTLVGIRNEEFLNIVFSGHNPAPENVPRQGETTTGTGNWRREGIICPRKSDKLKKTFHFFQTLFT